MRTLLATVAIFANVTAVAQDPAPLTDVDVTSTFIDPLGRVTQYETGSLGEVLGTVDTAGLSRTVNRDSNGNPTSATLPDGSVAAQSFDVRGNSTSTTDQTLGGTTSVTYEAEFSQITAVTDPFFATTTITYDGAGNPLQLTTPQGRVTSATYTPSGQIGTLTDTLGTVISATYNADDLPIQLVAGSGATQRQAERTYTAAGYIDTETDPEGRVYDFDYDALGRITQATLPDSRNLIFSYDNAGNLERLTPPGRGEYAFTYTEVGLLSSTQYPTAAGGGTNRKDFSYNADRQLAQITRADGINIDLAYDTAGRLDSVSQPDGDFTINYDAVTGQVTSMTSPDGITQTNSYNNELLTQLSWTGAVAGSIGYDYDAKGRITTFTIGGQDYNYAFSADDDVIQAGDQTLTYDAVSGLLTSTSLGEIDESFTYNQFAELVRHTVTIGANTLYDVTYTRDDLGRITQQVENIEGSSRTTDYTYDLASRVTTVTESGTLIATYTYDSNDNRTDHGGVYDAQDRITAQSGITYDYSADGERTQKTEGLETISYLYDAQSTLVGATLANGDQIDYLLDGQSRRVAKHVNGTTTDAWLYGADGVSAVARLNSSNTITQRYVYGRRMHVPDYVETGAAIFKVISDYRGSVRLVVNASDGSIVQRMDYDVWGNITADTNAGFQPFGFAGGLYDTDTRLTQFGLREYDPVSGHWTSKDPIGFSGSDNNLYTYVSSDPVNLIDPIGTDGERPDTAIGQSEETGSLAPVTQCDAMNAAQQAAMQNQNALTIGQTQMDTRKTRLGMAKNQRDFNTSVNKMIAEAKVVGAASGQDKLTKAWSNMGNLNKASQRFTSHRPIRTFRRPDLATNRQNMLRNLNRVLLSRQ